MYKKMIKTLVMAGLAALTLGSVPALAEEDSLSVSADVGVFSQYVWRGYALSDDSLIVQPSLTFAYGGFGLNFWGNYDSDYYGTGSDYNETDVTLSYDWSYDSVSMGLGYIYYDVDGGDTSEIYYTIGFDTVLAPSITVYRDIDAFEGWYVNLGIGHSIPVADDLALDLSAAIGYADYDGYSELHDGIVSASMTFPVTDSFSITPSLAYTFGLSSDAKDELEDADGDSGHFVAGITGSYSF
jgi:hypothetical protein